MVYIAVGRNEHVIANMDAPDNGCVRSYPDVVPNSWRPLTFTTVFLTDGNAFMEVAVFANLGFWVYRNGIWMPQVETWLDVRSIAKLKSIFCLHVLSKENAYWPTASQKELISDCVVRHEFLKGKTVTTGVSVAVT